MVFRYSKVSFKLVAWPGKINCVSVVLKISSILVFKYLTYEIIRTITAYTVLLPGDDP